MESVRQPKQWRNYFATLRKMAKDDTRPIPTTDEMDKTTPTERYSLVAICTSCNEPHYFTSSRERNSQTDGEVCSCGGKQFTGLVSQRTFNPALAKRKVRRR